MSFIYFSVTVKKVTPQIKELNCYKIIYMQGKWNRNFQFLKNSINEKKRFFFIDANLSHFSYKLTY